MEVLVGQRNLLEVDIDKMILGRSNIVFDLISNENFCKFQYSDGEYLINKLIRIFEENVSIGDTSLFYFRRLIFGILVNWYDNQYRCGVIQQLNQFCDSLNDKSKFYVRCLIEELVLYNKKENGESLLCSKEQLQQFFGIKKEFFSTLNLNELSYPLINVGKSTSKVITIDSPYGSTHDDAISIEKTSYGYLLGIYISDVASSICDNRKFYKYALSRCESIYYGNGKCCHMFPSDVRHVFSLSKGKYKKVVGHFFKLNHDFSFTGDFWIEPTRIELFCNYTFCDIDKILQYGGSSYELIMLFWKFYEKNKSLFNLDYHTLKEEKSINNFSNSSGSKIIEVISLFLNSNVARVMKEKGYPFIYRVNQSNLVEGLSQSSYSSVPIGHVVNNGECYGRVTNPIRKFTSLLNQYFELKLLIDDKYRRSIFDKKEFICDWLNKLSKIVDDVNTGLLNNLEFFEAIEILGLSESRDKSQKTLTRLK